MKRQQKFKMYDDEERQDMKLRDRERNSARKDKTKLLRRQPEVRKESTR